MSAQAGSDSGTPQRLGTERAYSGRVISIDLDSVRFPDGSLGELEIVRHPGASAVVPFLDDPDTEDPRIVLIRQYRYAATGFLYEIPAGRLEAGEAPLACAERELREETGYLAARLDPMMTLYTTPGFTDERIHLFMARGLSQGPAAREWDEFIEPVVRPLSEAAAMIERGELQDAKSALAILFARAFRRPRG